jgi:ankyrin repeat protein
MWSYSSVDDFEARINPNPNLDFFDTFADVLTYTGRLQQLLQLGADTNMLFENGQTALTMAAWNGNHEMVNLLLNAPKRADPNKSNRQGETPLHRAAERGHTETVQVLLTHSANPNVSNTYGETPLHRAVYFTNDKGSAVVTLLLNKPSVVNVNAIDKLGQTPLHHAVKYGREAEVALLLDANASPNVIDNKGHTPLHLGIYKMSSEIVKILLTKKADPNLKNNNGETPLDLARSLNDTELINLLRIYSEYKEWYMEWKKGRKRARQPTSGVSTPRSRKGVR